MERGLLWPATDVGAADVLFAQVSGLERVYQHVAEFNVAVQAGGNCGLWPRALGEKFATVYTFEPDPINFRCLCANAPAENIFKFDAAIGARHGGIGLKSRPDNVGAHHVAGKGIIPTLRIDDLALEACNLICLDIEGFELSAIFGAVETIARHEPTIVIEDKKGLEHVYGTKKGQVVKHLAKNYGYRVVDEIDRDVVLAIP